MPCYCIRSTNTQFCSNLCIQGKAWLAGQSDTTYILVYNNYQKLKTNISYRHRWQVCQSRMTFYQQQANRRGLRDSGCLAIGICTSRLHLRFKKPPCKKKKISSYVLLQKKIISFLSSRGLSQFVSLSSQLSQNSWVLDNSHDIQETENLTGTDVLLLKCFSLHGITINACTFCSECRRIHDAQRNAP